MADTIKNPVAKAATSIVVGLVVAAIGGGVGFWASARTNEYRLEQAEQEIRELRTKLEERTDLMDFAARLAALETWRDQGSRYTKADAEAFEQRHDRVHAGMERRLELLERK